MLREFRQFMLRGRVIDLAVAVVLGAAFGALVGSLVTNLLSPIVAAIIGKPDFSSLYFTINHSVFYYGKFIDQLISFTLIGLAVFFFVVKPATALARITGEEEETERSEELALLTEIRDLLSERSDQPR